MYSVTSKPQNRWSALRRIESRPTLTQRYPRKFEQTCFLALSCCIAIALLHLISNNNFKAENIVATTSILLHEYLVKVIGRPKNDG